MDKEQYCAAKVRLVTLMQEGQPWRGAAATAGIPISQSTAYRLLQEVHMRGEAALQDGRRLLFRVQGAEILRLDAQEQAVA